MRMNLVKKTMIVFVCKEKYLSKVSPSSYGNFERNGRRAGPSREIASGCRDADHRKKVMPNVHDTSKLPHNIFPMKFVKQSNSVSFNKDSCKEKNSIKTENQVVIDKRIFPDIEDTPVPAKIQKLTSEKSHSPKSWQTDTSISTYTDTTNISATTLKHSALSFENVEFFEITLSNKQNKGLKDLVLRQRPEELAITIINSSADSCKLPHEYSFEQKGLDKDAPRYTCSLYINGVLVGKAEADSKRTAKRAAATSALDLLRRTQPTILISSLPGDLDSAISRADVISHTGKSTSEQKIAESNVGNQLLRKMGWKGEGGLGKSGSGIAVPVTVSETHGRAGLGIESKNLNFISYNEAHNVIRKYAASQSAEELTFSPELTNEERAKIHALSRRYGLKSKSYNNGENRYLVVSRKMSAAALVDHLKSSGGSKGNVQLIVPGYAMSNFQRDSV